MSALAEINGTPQYRLDEIHELSDDVVGSFVPIRFEKSAFVIDNRYLLRKVKEGEAPPVVREFTADEAAALKLFDGARSIRSIAELLSQNIPSLSCSSSFSLVRALFEELSPLMVFIPKNKPEASEPSGDASGR